MHEFKNNCELQFKEIVYTFSNSLELRKLVKQFILSADVKSNIRNWNGKEVRVLIAADKELNKEKLEFTELIAHLNEVLEPRGIRLHRVKWTPQGADNIRNILNDCEICLNLYWENFSQIADEEMEIAYRLSTNDINPLHLYIFFKEPSDGIVESLAKFKNGFETVYGHFFCKFKNVDTMRLHFILQFVASHSMITVSNSSIEIAGEPFVDISNVSFATNNKNYIRLCNDIKRQKHRLAKHPDDIEEQKHLHLLLEERQTEEEKMLDVARQIYSDSIEQLSPQMIEARRLFEEGELSAVVKILNFDYIISDIQSSKCNIDRLTISKEIEAKKISRSIEEALVRIKTERLLHEDGWIQKITNEYILLINESRHYAPPLIFAKLLFDASRFLEKFNPKDSTITYYIECIDVMDSIRQNTSQELSLYGDMLYYAGSFFSSAVYDIDYDPTAGQWMDIFSMNKIHAKVKRRWRNYRKLAKYYLIKSVDVFESINDSNQYDEDIYSSLKCLTSPELWDSRDKKGEKSYYNKMISFVKKSKLSPEFLLSSLTDYAIYLYTNNILNKRDKKEFEATINECQQILETLDIEQLMPNVLVDISNLYDMKNDNNQAARYCRCALIKYEKLSEDNPYQYYANIADCLEQLARYVSWDTGNYKVNPETFHLLDRAEGIFNSLYKSTENNVFWNRAGHIKNLRFNFRLRERIDYGAFIFDTIQTDLKNYFSSHIESGKHSYIIDIKDSPIKNIGIKIRKIRNKDEYELLYTWEIDEGRVESCSMGKFRRGTRQELYQYLLDPDCYCLLKESIIRHLDKSWNMD